MSDEEFYDEDENGNITNAKGETFLQCQKCYGEGVYDQSESDASDWGEDCCSDAPGTIYRCTECRGEGGWWVKFKSESETKA